jgi:hypothetical protein
MVTPVHKVLPFSEVKEEEVEESPETGRKLNHSPNINLVEVADQLNKQPEQVEQLEHSEPEGEDGDDDGDDGEGEGDQSEQIPLLFVDVNLGEGTTDRIVLYDGDDPSEVAKEFSTRHNLDASMTGKLTDLLTQQMNGVLTKIIEEGDDAEHEAQSDS